ncbi:MAG: GTP cyclohydrolase I FolE [Candidatus Dormiibacterota bacterium]
MTPEREATPLAGVELEDAVLRLLQVIGEDPQREGLVDTPRRVAESIRYLTDGYGTDPAQVVNGVLFHHDGNDPVVVRGVPFYSLCEHHLLPFFGRCHIAYVPAGRVVGLSKLPRLIDVFAHRLQLQERLTRQIAEAVAEAVRPRGVAVVMEARHLCVEMRGVQKIDSDTVTSCLLGDVREDASLRAEILDLIRAR